tara:strand:- start:370 stop:510 length:141 start_codon:yes stop_codon:yes gene_type:complete
MTPQNVLDRPPSLPKPNAMAAVRRDRALLAALAHRQAPADATQVAG